MIKSRTGNTRNISNSGYSFQYRCPACHYLVEEKTLFEAGCPICGWTSPLREKVCIKEQNEQYEQIDIVDDGDFLRVTAELPILNFDKLFIEASGKKLLISADRYIRIIPLDHEVSEEFEKTLRNGVLDIKLKKTGR